MAKLTRRNFLAGSALVAAAGLAACNQGGGTAPADGGSEPAPEPEPAGDIFAAPDASAYPIDPDAEGTEALWTSEQTRDGWTRVTADGAPELGIQDASKIIQVNGLAFKDLNGNGKLDLYEDWRQPHDVRAAALAEMMSAEDAMLLMWHGGDEAFGGPGAAADPDAPAHALCIQGSRAGVSRLASDLDSYATDIAWINEVQAVCEDSAYGVPYLNSTDPYFIFGIPDPVALAATMDKDIWRKAGMWFARAWRATGVRCDLGPQVDVYSQPIGCRLSGSVCEDPAVNRDFVKYFGGGMQSTWADDEATEDLGWGKDSVAIMLKHYVGEGSVEGGRNDHSNPGAYNVFPGDNFNAHLIPFLDGGLNLESKTGQMAAIMSCYGIAFSEDEEYGENVGMGYNKKGLGILRNAGWDGMITTDWGIMNSQIYGVEKLTEAERYAKMVDATVDQYGGGFSPEIGKEAMQILVDKYDYSQEEMEARMKESARRVAKVMMDVDLFENPYSDRSAAKEILESPAAAAFGMEAAEKSVVMLKNKGNVLSAAGIEGKPKAYVSQRLVTGSFMDNFDPYFEMSINEEIAGQYFDVVTDNIGEPSGIYTPMFGEPDPTRTVYQKGDASLPSAEELKDVKYAIIGINAPKDPNEGVGGSGGMGMGMAQDPVEYLPITLQYRTYTADTAREVSIGGDLLEDGTRENRSYRGKSQTASNESDLDKVIALREALPEDAKLICIIEAKRPMVFSELEPYCDVILMIYNEFATSFTTAIANIVTCQAEPYGVLSLQQPKNMETVEAQLEDVPRDMECYVDSEGNTYDFCFGLNWSGVIDDERTKTYKAAPLTEPEIPVIM